MLHSCLVEFKSRLDMDLDKTTIRICFAEKFTMNVDFFPDEGVPYNSFSRPHASYTYVRSSSSILRKLLPPSLEYG